MYLKWAKALGPVYRIKAAFFQPDVVSYITITFWLSMLNSLYL